MGHESSKHNRDKGKSSHSSSSKTYSATKSVARNPVQKYDLSNFAVITVIFNPIKYKSRYDHYQKFEGHMSHSNVNLITVECIFESAPHFGLPRQNFEITRAGDRRHIQLIAPSILWMKENLINIAIQRLPKSIEYVAWLDADIEFDRIDWPYLAIAELQRYPIVQLFELSYFLGPGGKKDILRRDYSFGYSIRHNKPIEPGRFNEWYAHPGYAWAMRRSAFDSIGGLVDFCIIGSGDLHFAFALLHRIEETLRPGLHQDYRKLAITWGDRVAELAKNGTNVSYVPVNLWHYWHGERNDRNYVDRWTILEKHQFSPLNDLEKNDDSGLLRLADKRRFGRPELVAHIEALEHDIVAYFKSRNEDNNVRTNQVQPPPPRVKTKPFVAAKTQPHRSGASKPPRMPPSNRRRGSSRPQIWSSGPAGTHVDDDNPYWDQCCCPGHHHQPGNHHCPCSPDHTNDQTGWNPSEHGHHHHSDDHHHHHHDVNEHHHHGGGYDYHHGGGGGYGYQSGGGFDNTNYGGPGSFY